MANTKITLDMRGLESLIKRALKVDDAEVLAGVQGDADRELLTYAAANEFGTRDGRVPERSYIRSTAKAKEEEWENLAENLAADAFSAGTFDLEAHLDTVGAAMVGDIQDTITNLRTPPNAPGTIAKKKSSNPLIDTGRLRAAITHKH